MLLVLLVRLVLSVGLCLWSLVRVVRLGLLVLVFCHLVRVGAVPSVQSCSSRRRLPPPRLPLPLTAEPPLLRAAADARTSPPTPSRAASPAQAPRLPRCGLVRAGEAARPRVARVQEPVEAADEQLGPAPPSA